MINKIFLLRYLHKTSSKNSKDLYPGFIKGQQFSTQYDILIIYRY